MFLLFLLPFLNYFGTVQYPPNHEFHSPNESEFDVSSGSVEKREGFGVSEVGDISSLDGENHVSTLQMRLGWRAGLNLEEGI